MKQPISYPSMAGIILGAGMSTRLGHPKQLIRLGGRYLIERIVTTCLASCLDHVVVVLGYAHQQILQAIEDYFVPQLEVVTNPDYALGQSTSLKAGLIRVMDRFSSVMCLVADQPYLTVTVIDQLIFGARLSPRPICVPRCQGQMGNPVVFKNTVFPMLLSIDGDMGARYMIRSNPNLVTFVDFQDPIPFMDIDTWEDVRRLERMGKRPCQG